MTFGENLINLRKKNKMTQEEVAEKLDITRQTVSNWELNQTKPDLDQLKQLSALYKISIDELVYSDIQKNIANKVNNSEKSNLFHKAVKIILVNKKIIFMIFTLMCIMAVGICLIVDYAINGTITWSDISVLSIIFGYLIIMPTFTNKNKILLFLLTLTITILPFLYLMEMSIPIKEWFYSLAIPVSIIGICGIWISYFVCCFFEISEWYKAAILIFIVGAIMSPIINHIIDGLPYYSLQNYINVFSSLVVSLACTIYGYIKNSKIKNK